MKRLQEEMRGSEAQRLLDLERERWARRATEDKLAREHQRAAETDQQLITAKGRCTVRPSPAGGGSSLRVVLCVVLVFAVSS